MSRATVVRYTTRPDAADENERLIRAVFAHLGEQKTAGVRYTVIRLEDGVSFVHVATFDGDSSALTGLPAFHEFASGVGERCVDGPAPVDGTVIDSYGA